MELPSRFRLDTTVAGEAYHTDIEDILKCIRRCAERNEAFVIRTTGSGDAVKSVMLNGKPHDPLFLRHSEIASGGELVFAK